MDTDCAGTPSTPRCDTGTHLCVACVNDGDCDLGKVCNTTNHTCAAGCSSDHGCGPGEGVCDVSSGFCVDCLADGDCHDASKPFCDKASHQCFPCTPDHDTCGYEQYCGQSGGTYTCVSGCKDDTDCGPPPVHQPDMTTAGDGGSVDADGGIDGGSVDASMSTPDMSVVRDGGTPVSARCDKVKHQCERCVEDSDCPLSKICKAGACVAGCTDTHGCADGLACCDDGTGSGAKACIDTRGNNLNCGACGMACQGGLQCCNSVCIDPSKDNNNCGSCGNVCMAPHGTPVCDRSVCTVPSCSAGWANCNGNPGDGCEVQTDTNTDNCGGCGNKCSAPQAAMQCTAGTCSIASCNTGFGDCDGSISNGCETNVFNSVNNCGICGQVCPNGGQFNVLNGGCNVGTCTVLMCSPGYANCDGIVSPSNGCEVNVKTDALNCNGCGNDCSNICKNKTGANQVASTSCDSGECKVATCKTGWRDMNNDCADGCECSTQSPGGSTCADAMSVGPVNIGAAPVTVTANMADPAVSVRWFKVTFQLNNNYNGYLAHPFIAIDNNTFFAFTVSDAASCTTTPLTCKGENGNSNTPMVSWETKYDNTSYTPNLNNAALQAIPAGEDAGKEPIKATGASPNTQGTVYVQVRKKTGSGNFTNCLDSTFVLTFKNS